MDNDTKRIIVEITDGKRTYSEDVTEEQKESFEECSAHDLNPWLTSFDSYTREISWHESTTDWLNQFNTADENAHFIYGWFECLSQSSNVPEWMYEAESLKIRVRNEPKISMDYSE
ncbi:hypothetical protein A3K80_09135 [Candidatus Bathyarchaeota archaeon RBG_13_38_9]|nr:MAG: hypothetical protein A3K80_09135 [Candidatus Bathyarchaeota archaeon RBG_13_38_9]